jgi:kynureninase
LNDLSLAAARSLDDQDDLGPYRGRFDLPHGRVYLDGNSLGALPKATMARLAEVAQAQWGQDLIGSWNRHDWINSPVALGAKVSGLIGASPDEVVVTDTTSVNLYRLIITALEMQRGRHEVLSEAGNFPTDLYVCEGATRTFGRDATLRVVPRDRVVSSIGPSTALLLLTHVHYKTSDLYPMAEITAAAHARGALVLWDLSHSAGAVEVDLAAANADFAVGCGYKYLNGGPGAPSFLYVARRHQARALNPISGWHGHARPFDFTDEYSAAPGIRRFLSGTPSILANAALEVGLDLLLEAGMARIAAKARRLTGLFIALVESRCADFGLTLMSPRPADARGSHVSFSHPNGYEIMQALISESVVGDFRAPDIMRFGFTPLYTRFEDVWIAVDRLRHVLETECWREPRFAERASVT